jgi:DNA replication and repair protein RecF
VEPWSARVAELGTALDAARADVVGELAPRFAEAADALGLPGGRLAYEHRPLELADLAARLDRDLERATTGAGPHLRDVTVAAGTRDLRSFGSQGEQRTAVLALVLAEAGLAVERRGAPPLLLLDDVLSELDRTRRSALLARLPADAQTLVTATSTDELPASGPEPALVIDVVPGEARRR